MKTIPSLTPFLSFVAISAFAASAAASAPTVSIAARSSSISSGQTDTLTVTETSAASIHVTGSNGASYNLPYSGGTIAVAPTSTVTYTATAMNSSGSVRCPDHDNCELRHLHSVHSNDLDYSEFRQYFIRTVGHLDYGFQGCLSHVTGSNGTSYNCPIPAARITVSPSSTTTYTATATNSSGEHDGRRLRLP